MNLPRLPPQPHRTSLPISCLSCVSWSPPIFRVFRVFRGHPDTLRASRSALAPPAPLRGFSALKRPITRRGSSAATAAATSHELSNFVPFACFVVHYPFSACSVVTPTLFAPLAPPLRILRLFAATPLRKDRLPVVDPPRLQPQPHRTSLPISCLSRVSWSPRHSSRLSLRPCASCASSRLLRSEKIDCPSWILRGYSRSHIARTSQFRAFRVFRGHHPRGQTPRPRRERIRGLLRLAPATSPTVSPTSAAGRHRRPQPIPARRR